MINNSEKLKIIVVCGPTGVGKTGFAIALAQPFGAQIVGADSMQIYRYMDIGTAKPTERERATVPHHMVDIADPDQEFDAASYSQLAYDCVNELLSQGKLPFVVGGTGLYIKSLIYGLSEGAPADPAVRYDLQRRLSQFGLAEMYQYLIEKDPDAGRRIHPNDSYRILRALEVYEITGQSIYVHHKLHGFRTPRFNVLHIGLKLPREQLYMRIDQRVDAMLAEGLKQEVTALLNRGYDAQLKSMQALGYRHLIDHLRDGVDWEETVSNLKRDHRRYAKRQMTWFGAVEGMHWLTPSQIDEAVELIEDFLSPDNTPEQG